MNDNQSTLVQCLAAQQNTARWRLHEIEAEDVSISEEAISVIRDAARKILARYVPVENLSSLTLGDAVALFSTRVFWNEENGKLLMCSQLADGSLCLPIPEGHWRVRENHINQ